MRLSGSVFSKTLDMDTGLTIVTPNDLEARGEYNVCYLLHGVCGDSRTWLDYSLLPVYAGDGDTIYILPDAARSFYADMNHGFRYFSYITEELPGIVKSVFNVSARRERTAVMGGSMGGYGALKCALARPDIYGMCAAFSSGCLFLKEGLEALRRDGMGQAFIDAFGEQLSRDFDAIFGPNYDYSPECDVLALSRSAKASGALPKLYLTCGEEDFFYADHERFCEFLNKERITHKFEHWSARHDFIYFNEALRRAIAEFSL